MATKKTSDESDGHQTKILEVQATSFRSTFQASVDKIQWLTHVKRFQNVPKRFGAHFWGGLFCFQTLAKVKNEDGRNRSGKYELADDALQCMLKCDTQRHGCNPSQNERSFYGLTCALISKNLACAGKVAGGFVHHRAQHLRTSFRTQTDCYGDVQYNNAIGA